MSTGTWISLLKELGSISDERHYKHLAPDGAKTAAA